MTKLIFGSWGLGGASNKNPAYENISENKAIELLNFVYRNGVKSIDTSPAYGNGSSEMRIGKYLTEICKERSNIEIITKVGFADNFRKINLNEKEIKKSLDNSLNRLQTNYIDVLLIHSPQNSVLKHEYSTLKNIMQNLKHNNKIKEWGISLKSPEDLKYIDKNNHPSYIQLNYNILDQRLDSEPNFELLASRGVVFHARTVFFYGFLIEPRLYMRKFEAHDHRSKITFNDAYKYCLASRYMLFPIKNIKNKYTRDEVSLAFVKNNKNLNGILLGSLHLKEWKRNIEINNLINLDIEAIKIYKDRYKKIEKLLKK